MAPRQPQTSTVDPTTVDPTTVDPTRVAAGRLVVPDAEDGCGGPHGDELGRDLGQEIGDTLYQLVAMTARRMPRDLSLTAAATLHTLAHRGPLRLCNLASVEGVTQPTMTALVTRLEAHGYAERMVDPGDGRAVLVGITPGGSDYLAARRKGTSALLAQLVASLSHEDTQRLHQSLPALQSLSLIAQADADADADIVEPAHADLLSAQSN